MSSSALARTPGVCQTNPAIGSSIKAVLQHVFSKLEVQLWRWRGVLCRPHRKASDESAQTKRTTHTELTLSDARFAPPCREFDAVVIKTPHAQVSTSHCIAHHRINTLFPYCFPPFLLRHLSTYLLSHSVTRLAPLRFCSCVAQPEMFDDWALLNIGVDAPGATSANVSSLGHTFACRQGRRLYPMDDWAFKPTVERLVLSRRATTRRTGI